MAGKSGKTRRVQSDVPSGPVSLFRHKVRAPVSITYTPRQHAKVKAAMERLGLSRSDLIALLIERYADVVQITAKA